MQVWKNAFKRLMRRMSKTTKIDGLRLSRKHRRKKANRL